MRDHYDFSGARKNPYAKHLKKQVTIRLDVPTLDYFKRLADEVAIPYQTLVNFYLRECVEARRRPLLNWVTDGEQGQQYVSEPPARYGRPDSQGDCNEERFIARELENRASAWLESGVPSVSEGDEVQSFVVAYIVCRAHRIYVAGVRLCGLGFGAESAMQARSLVEDVISLRAILAEPELAQRWFDFQDVERKQALESVEELDGDLFDGYRSRWAEDSAQILENASRFEEEHGDAKRHWHGAPNLWELAKSEGVDSTELYHWGFKQNSKMVHLSPSAIAQYVDEGGFRFRSSSEETGGHLLHLVIAYQLLWDEIAIVEGAPTRDEVRSIYPTNALDHFRKSR